MASKQMEMYRKVALSEQKKVQQLRESGENAKELAEAEARLRDLTRRMQELTTGHTNAYDEARRRGNEVHLDMSEDELRAWREVRGTKQAETEQRPCAVCSVLTSRSTTTGRTTSFLCSARCQRVGWTAHLERVRNDEARARRDRERDTERSREDAAWDRQTAEKLREDTITIDIDFLGVPRGACAQTGCVGYVQQRGAPRDIAPSRDKDGKLRSGVWSWNRVDHLACRRCGAPADLHENLKDQIMRRNRTATAVRPTSKHKKALSSTTPIADSEYRRTKADACQSPTRIQVEENSDDDAPVDFIGGRPRTGLKGAPCATADVLAA